MFHQPLMLVMVRVGMNSEKLTKVLGNKAAAIIAINAAGFSTSILAALVSWHLYEKHFLKWKDSFSLSRA